MTFTKKLINQVMDDEFRTKSIYNILNCKLDDPVMLPLKEKYLLLDSLKINFQKVNTQLDKPELVTHDKFIQAINFVLMELSLRDGTFTIDKGLNTFVKYLNK